MAISVKTVADKVFNLLKGYGYEVDTFDKVGEVVGDPAEAIRFFVEDPNLLVTLNVPKEEIRLSVTENSGDTDTLRSQLSNIARDHLMTLDFRLFGKTLKPASDSVNVAKENSMKETNELRKLAGLPLKEEESLEDKLKSTVEGYKRSINDYHEAVAELEKDPEYQNADEDMKDELLYDYVDGENINDLEDKLEHFEGALADHQKNGTTHWWQSEFVSTDTLVRDEIAQEMSEMGAWRGDLEEAVEEDEMDSFKGSTKDGHKYRAVADDQDYSQYLKVFYGDGKYFRIYYDSNAGGYDHTSVAPETNDPRAEEVFANLPDDFFKKYGSEGETGLEDIIDMIKKEDKNESISEATLGSSYGSLKTSYQPLDNVKLVVKHTKPVNEEIRGSRSRNISKIFIQANEERFLFPSKNLQGARAMARHIYNGGVMHDAIGESIVQMCKDIKTLREFVRYVSSKGLVNEANNEYVTLAKEHIENIKTTFKRVAGSKSYSKAVESLNEYDNIEIVNEVNLEDHFTETHFDNKVGNAHETLSKLVNKKSAFESYIMNAIESETFEGAKEVIEEEPLEFANPHSKLGYQVSQLSTVVGNQRLANYLGSIGSKLSDGGSLDPMEYRAVKASLLSAQQPTNVAMAEDLAENKSKEYEKFIDSFVIFDK